MRLVDVNVFVYWLEDEQVFGEEATGIIERIEKGEKAVGATLSLGWHTSQWRAWGVVTPRSPCLYSLSILTSTSPCGCMDLNFDPFRVFLGSSPAVTAYSHGVYRCVVPVVNLCNFGDLILRLYYSTPNNVGLPLPGSFTAQLSTDPGHSLGSAGTATGIKPELWQRCQPELGVSRLG